MNQKQIESKKKKLGNRMKAFRLQVGYTSVDRFTFENKISRLLYSNWEAGKGNITYKNLLKCVDAYGTTIEDFFSTNTDDNL